MKKLIALGVLSLVLNGCASPVPTVKPVSYGLPNDCKVAELLKLDNRYAAVNQTASGVDDSLDCVIGVPDSDVGIFFGYSVRTREQWMIVTAKLVAEGYKKWNSGVAGAELWRKETGDAETGSNCSLSGYVPGISFSVTEPWAKCDDKWNKQLAGYLIEKAAK